MSRKDTIIVAVLLNAGLLVVLFVSALKNEPAVAVAHTHTPPPTPKKIEAAKIVTPAQPTLTLQATTQPKKVEVKKPEPAVVAVKPEPKKAAPKEVAVEKGDVLEKIAKTHNVSVSSIMQFNNLSDTRLQIGQVLKIPGVRSLEQKKLDPQYYIVKEGDSPWVIAQKHGMRTADLLKLNDLDEQSAKKLRPGHKLRVK